MGSGKNFPDDFEATIRIFRADEGGRQTPPFNGIRWDFNYAEEMPAEALYMIRPDFLDSAGTPLPYDKPLPVDVALSARMYVIIDNMRAEIHRARMHVGSLFYCCEGHRRVAEGIITRITGLHNER